MEFSELPLAVVDQIRTVIEIGSSLIMKEKRRR